MLNNFEAPRGSGELFLRRNQLDHREVITAPEAQNIILPLGSFSNFVVNEQPMLLAQVRAGHLNAEDVAQRQQELLTGLGQEEVQRVISDRDMARFAMLDLSFAMSGLTFSGIAPPIEAQQLNAQLAQVTGIPEMMTFEKIVSINARLPFHQMRAFTDGSVGDTERRFYYGHALMDEKMQDTTDIVTQSIDVLRTQGEEGVDEATELLTRGASNMEEFADFMRAFMRMPREHFAEFRQYLSQYPDGTRNASGAFIGMPRLHMRLAGLSPRYKEFLDEGMQYFPVGEQQDIELARRLAQEGDYLVAQCEGLIGEPQKRLARALIQVIEPIRDFRLSHLAAVSYHVPQALPEGLKDLKTQLAQTEEEPILDDASSDVKGTAGFLPGPLLRNTLRMDLRALERLNAIINR